MEKAELFLLDLGLTQVRVRVHGNIARIEALPSQFSILLDKRTEISEQCKAYGFAYAAMDLLGYRTGSMSQPM